MSQSNFVVDKAWKGERGDKRNTKYVLSAWGGGPIGVAAYSAYRNSEKGQLARAASIEAKRKKRGKRKKSVSKSAGTLVKIPTKVGRFRGAAENTAIRGAGAAGRTLRYVRDNAMPLTIGATVGASGATAYQQTKNRRNTMSKGLPSALKPAAGKLVPAMKNPAVRERVQANTMGRAAGLYRSRGMSADAAQRTRIGQDARFRSSSTFRRSGG